jgi:hypothetical protein
VRSRRILTSAAVVALVVVALAAGIESANFESHPTATVIVPTTITTTVTATQTQRSDISSELSFIHDQLAISQACASGNPVSSGWQTTTVNATGQKITNYFKPVLVMQEPSTAYVCVTYQSLTGPQLVNSSFYDKVIAFGFSLSACQKITQNGTGLECSHSNALAGSASPSQIELTNYTSTFTVIYNITSTSGSMGFYDSAGDTFWGYPLASGYTTSQINASNFHILLSGHPTPFEPIHSIFVSVIGMNVTYVDFPCTTSPICISGK